MLAKLLKLVKMYQSDIVLTFVVIFISMISFNLGKISILHKQKLPITITEPVNSRQATGNNEKGIQNSKLEPSTYNLTPSFVVASKNSANKIYHFPWCPSASKITEKNKITFATETAAISAGYILAGNCNP
ncbi:MAG: hypothetical protein HYT61_02100 [Candidatus Yanofskybacteria bacterium]|nr:hypothetical protein [Candidatus Yanofskybacteria bacterium]